MYIPSFRVKRNGVPILKGTEIDTIGENFVRDFQPGVLTDPAPVDIDSFVECYLGMTPDFQYLSHNGVYLGMTVFNETNKVPVYDPHTNRAEYIHADARTVIIDTRLLDDNQQHRYRFTLGHEAGHDIFHSGFFSYNPDQQTLFDTTQEPMIQCRIESTATQNPNRKTDTRQWSDREWMEWHSNRLASALLMPESAVRLIAAGYFKGGRFMDVVRRTLLVKKIADTFDVSLSAATYRLKDLGYIEQSDYSDYASGTAIFDFAEVVGYSL